MNEWERAVIRAARACEAVPTWDNRALLHLAAAMLFFHNADQSREGSA